MVLENIDNNDNKQIDLEELSKAISDGFFDKTENINEIKKQLNNSTIALAQSLKNILEIQYKEIITKFTKSIQDQKIVALYNKLSLQYGTYPPLIKNNLTIEKEKNNTAPLPNLLNVDLNHNIDFNNIANRAKNKYQVEYGQLTINMRKKYNQKSPEELSDYIKYESIVRAMEKYYEGLNEENNNLLKKHGFYSTGTIKDDLGREQEVEVFGGRESFACGELFKFLETIKYQEYEEDQNIISTYNKNLEKILKNNGYLGNNLFQQHTILYKNFKKEAEKLAEETKYEESIKYLAENSEPESADDIEVYMNHVDNTLQYGETYELLTKKYGPKMLAGYERTMGQITKLQSDNAGFLSAMDRMSLYNQKLNQKKDDLNINDDIIHNYISYIQEANLSIYTLQGRYQTLAKKLYEEVSQDTGNNFIFPAIKQSIVKQKNHQTTIDNRRNKIKSVIPRGYYAVSTIAGAWNGLVDATISVGTGIGVLITSLYRDQNQTIANIDRAKERNAFFKIGYSSEQLEPPIKNGTRNLGFDNGSVQLGAQVTNMLVLLSGAGLVGRGAATGSAKIGLKMTESLGRKVGLFTRASMQGLPNTFQTYIDAGINKSDAWKYALGSTLLTSSLEMIAPNDMFFGSPSIRGILTQLGKEKGSQIITKIFIKNISKEIIEEIGQESLQLVVERIINKSINNAENTSLETGLTWSDFGTTALLTALTTGIVSSKGSLQATKNTINHPKTIEWIVKNPERYEDYTSTLQQIIAGKKDSNISIDVAQDILNQIEIAATIKPDNETVIQNTQEEGDIFAQPINIEQTNNSAATIELDDKTVIQDIQEEQDIFDQPNDGVESTNPQEKISTIEHIQIKLFTLAQALSATSEIDLEMRAAAYMIENVKHFIHECKVVFGTELVDLYKSYTQMKNHVGKPGDEDFQKIFQLKAKARGLNLTKLIGVAAVGKIGIDPHLFFWSGHLVADQLQKHIPFFDKLFHLSFETMNDVYGRKEGNTKKYNPKTIIENGSLNDDNRKNALIERLHLDIQNPIHQELIIKLMEAHYIGQNAPGKNPAYTGGVYNYTNEQIRQKYAIIKPYIDQGVITQQQVKELFGLGYLGGISKKIFSKQQIIENSQLNDYERVKKAENLIGRKINQGERDAIINAHNSGGNIFQLKFGEIKEKFKILKEAKFNKEEIKVFLDSGICGFRGMGIDIIEDGIGIMQDEIGDYNNDGETNEVDGIEFISDVVDEIYNIMENKEEGGNVEIDGDNNYNVINMSTEKIHNETIVLANITNHITLTLGKINEVEIVKENGIYYIKKSLDDQQKIRISVGESIVLGRGGEYGESLNLNNTDISRNHVTISADKDGNLVVHDHSTNGTNITTYSNENLEVQEKKPNTIEQDFDLGRYTSQDLITNPILLTELYTTHILPQMEYTDLIKKNIMQDIATQTNATILDADLKGKEDPTRAIEKIITKLEGDPNRLLDISRGSLVFQDEKTLRIGLDILQTHPDIQEIQIKDNFERETGYRDINIIIKAKTGKCFELQLHTKSLLESKEHGLNIPLSFVEQLYKNIQDGKQKNHYGNILEKIVDNKPIFNQTDKRICNLVDTYIKSKKEDPTKSKSIQLPESINEKISGHDMYEVTRTIEIVLNPNLNPNKIIPSRLEGSSRESLESTYDNIRHFSNLLYDYAYTNPNI